MVFFGRIVLEGAVVDDFPDLGRNQSVPGGSQVGVVNFFDAQLLFQPRAVCTSRA